METNKETKSERCELLDYVSGLANAPENFKDRALAMVPPGLEDPQAMVVRTVTEADDMAVRVQYDLYLSAANGMSVTLYSTATNTADEDKIARCRVLNGAGTPGSIPKGGVWSNSLLPTHKHYRVAELDALSRAKLLDVLLARGEACWAVLSDRQAKHAAFTVREAFQKSHAVETAMARKVRVE